MKGKKELERIDVLLGRNSQAGAEQIGKQIRYTDQHDLSFSQKSKGVCASHLLLAKLQRV